MLPLSVAARPFSKTRPMEYVCFFLCVAPLFAEQFDPYYPQQIFVGEIYRCSLVRRTHTYYRHDCETNGKPRGFKSAWT